MIMPGQRRPGIWREGVLQIHVTRACDKACFGCTQGSQLAGKVGFMSPEHFAEACASLKGYFGVVGMFGGNPCIHPLFEELCRIMREYFPFEQRGLWSNNLLGKGKVCRETFNPAVSNINVHQDAGAAHEFRVHWPEAHVKGISVDSVHVAPFVSMMDVIPDRESRLKLIESCDVNKYWSALIGVFRGQLRGWFCELAGAQSMLNQYDPDYPDTGVVIKPGWWQQSQEDFQHQIDYHCHRCGIPLRANTMMANSGPVELTSASYQEIMRSKRLGRTVRVVDVTGLDEVTKATDYLTN